tara:strand:- start:3702 stop:4712 length:1011 start_codon:yes stop_codon:yes gene_type:complete
MATQMINDTRTELISLDERIGVDVSKARGFNDLMETAGFDFEMEKVPVHTPEGDEVPGNFAIRRQDTKRIFAVMRRRYNPVPLKDMFSPFHDMVQEFGAEYENAGIIDGGKKCWIAARLPKGFTIEGRPDDKVENRIMALAANDGTKRNAYLSLAHRIVCNNQIQTIFQAANQSDWSISHTKNWSDRLEAAQNGFHAALRGSKEFERNANKLNKMQITSDEVRGFANLLLPDPPRKKGEEVRETSRLVNRREQIVDLFLEGEGNRGLTRWDAFNGLTEWVNHHNNINKLEKHGRKAAERRFVNCLLGGPSDQMMQRGMSILLDEKKFKKIPSPALN